MDVIIRKAQLHDIHDLLKMNKILNADGCSTAEHMKASLENNQSEIVFVAIHNGAAIGFVCGQLHPSICYSDGMLCEVSELFVYEEYRRMGIATKLLRHIEIEFKQYNALEIFLQTGKKNINAQNFYENNGYAVRERVVYLKKEEDSTV